MCIFNWGIPSFARLACRCAMVMALAVLTTACGSANGTQTHAGHDAPANEISVDGLTISNAMASEAPLVGGNGAIYLTIQSETVEQLVSAASPSAALVEFHESLDDNGVMRMEPRPDGFEIPAAGAVELKRGGKHIMLMNLTDTLAAGDEIEVTLTFQNHEPVTLTVPVMAMGEMNHD